MSSANSNEMATAPAAMALSMLWHGYIRAYWTVFDLGCGEAASTEVSP
jgi:hypothetical protein